MSLAEKKSTDKTCKDLRREMSSSKFNHAWALNQILTPAVGNAEEQ